MDANSFPYINVMGEDGDGAVRFGGWCGTCGATMAKVKNGLYRCPKCQATTSTKFVEVITGHPNKGLWDREKAWYGEKQGYED